MEHKKLIGVDDIQNLDDAPIKFGYGKDLLPDWALTDCPPFMQRFQNWYKRSCRLGLNSFMFSSLFMFEEKPDGTLILFK